MDVNINIFRYIDYVLVIEKMIYSHRTIYGYKAKMAEAAGCQRSFFSQVLRRQVLLTPEQALGLTRFWNLTESGKDYFVNLVLLARSGNRELKQYYQSKIDWQRAEQNKLSQRLGDVPKLDESMAAKFFSNWHFLALNIIITIPQYRTVSKIAARLNLNEEFVERSLKELSMNGFAIKIGNEWQTTSAFLHQPKESIYSALNHSHWRKRATDDAFQGVEESVHYTSVVSLSREDVDQIKQLVLDLIENSRKLIIPSPSEELYCLNCDWFKV